ncbi:uncharacterized protein EKO05_0005291 [Ascochyta rabiei]|uniref:CFEM domain-containing protein n=1 Tax=Didymella rabiei TaxID=5454 RepID=A0A163G8W8_DIDRA|nr:uncharacterized protein EKO05_0005291 [Ascochyta rabiei]KZM24748.1 hypothetical protein ST47_g4130 [Ascochyta rabiei]UPX14819.1 hypothetical protein EKO05_0005291 [Ascochyta rabiei]
MPLSHFIRLCIISASLITAVPHNVVPTVTSVPASLPSQLQQNVPSCAHSCIRSSLSERFPIACTAQDDIGCLCSRYSTIGESLGEVALGCVYAACGKIDAAASAYNVCLGQRNAVLPTKTALTVVPSNGPSTTSRYSTSSTTSTSKGIYPSITRTTLETKTSASQPVFVDSISLPASATSTSISTPTSIVAPATNDDRPKMTPAQIAGLSVAAVSAFIIAIGLMALSVFLRRRKEAKSIYVHGKDQDHRRRQSAHFSHYVPVNDVSEASTQLPILPPPAASRDGPRYPRLVTPSPFSTLGISAAGSGRTVVRPGVGTAISAASVPMSQIGLAISAELEGCPAPAKSSNHPRQKITAEHFRPVSTRTENTVFEEDEIAARHRSSKLLPTPPVPIVPIRSLQPSRLNSKTPTTSATSSTHAVSRSELFLDIPVRHERPQPKRVAITGWSSTGPPALDCPAPKTQAPSSIFRRTTSSSETSITPASAADIPNYYFTSSPCPARDITPRQDSDTLPTNKSQSHAPRARRSPGTTLGSRTVSRTSTRRTFRDSTSSQTSFETADPNDPTPEDDSDDKQLSDDNKLSPVAESPIHALKYPKVPRASNQSVPRSPKIGSTRKSREEGRFYIRPLPEPSSLLVKRRGEREAQQLENKLVLSDPFVTPTRRQLRLHTRNASANSWDHTPASKIEHQSYNNSPLVDEADVVRPLSIVKKTDISRKSREGGEMIGLNSPVWIPHLTPTRKGEDLFISVGWGENHGKRRNE